MRARVLVLVLALLMGAGSPAAAQSLRVAQPNASRFPEVTLYAYPVDDRGILMAGLTARDFQVMESGRPGEDVRVESKDGTLDICLALDRSLSMKDEGKIFHAQEAARAFLKQIGPRDRAAIVTFGNGCTLDQGLTLDRGPLLAAVDRTIANGDETHFLDGIYWAITQVALKPMRPGSMISSVAPARSEARRVVVALTDGLDNGSHVFTPRLIEYSRANGVSLCMVALGGDAALPQMQSLAEATGGIYLRAPLPQDLERLYVSLAEQLRREYRVIYRTPDPRPDGTRRDVNVALAQSPLTAASWYQAPGQGSLLVTTPTGSGAAPAATTAAPAGGGGQSQLLFGILMLGVGFAGLAATLVYWLGTRGRRLPMRDSNPRVDLRPLWVRDGETLVGRGAECEVVLHSTEVSRIHARIKAMGGVFQVVDEGSRNGTYVNGRRVRRSRRIRVGDILRFGDQTFRFGGPQPD